MLERKRDNKGCAFPLTGTVRTNCPVVRGDDVMCDRETQSQTVMLRLIWVDLFERIKNEMQ